MTLSVNKLFQIGKKAAMALVIFVSRCLSLAPNFSPLGAYGFYGQNLGLFFANIIVFDWLKSGFYPGFIFTYLGFLGYFAAGKIAAKQRNKGCNKKFWFNFKWMSIASFWFFIISNLGVWFYWYPQTWQGLLSCYAVALPFYRNTVIGDITFSSIFMLSESAINSLRQQKHYQTQVVTS